MGGLSVQIMLSIIIPTHNEENYLPKLLDSIKKQTYKNYEIIVADGNSEDKTRHIGKKYGCKIVQDGGLGPGIGRNIGVKAAKGDILLFLDADSIIGCDYLKKSLDAFEKRELDIAGSYIYPSTRRIVDWVFLGTFNFWCFISQLFYPHACGTGIFCRKRLHNRVLGFDETIKTAEDMDYVNRCSKYGKFRLLRNSKIIYSMRRYENEGRLKTGFKIVLGEFHRIFLGEIRSDVLKYSLRYKK